MGLFDETGSGSDKPVYYVRIAVKDRPRPVFEIVSKDKGNMVEKESISGNIAGIQYTENKNKNGEVIQGFRISLDCPNEFALLSVGFTRVGRTLLNCLLNLGSPYNVKFNLWRNKDGFDNVQVLSGGNKVSWKFDPKTQLPQPEELIGKDGKPHLQNGKKVMIWDGVNNFFKDEMNKKFIGTNFQFATVDTSTAKKVEETSADVDLPPMPEDDIWHGSDHPMPEGMAE